MKRTSLVLLAFVACVSSAYAADDKSSRCAGAAPTRESITSHGGKWINLTHDQWEFLRGVSSLDPETPPGLPLGSSAVMAKIEGNAGALIFFIDGPKVCGVMPIPHVLVDMLMDIATGEIAHEGAGL